VRKNKGLKEEDKRGKKKEQKEVKVRVVRRKVIRKEGKVGLKSRKLEEKEKNYMLRILKANVTESK
jgi:hypothetical protein